MKDFVMPSWRAEVPSYLKLFLYLTILLDIAALASLPYYYVKYGETWRVGLWSEPSDRFGDFWHYRKLFSAFHTRAFFTSAERFAYPAPCAVITDFLFKFGAHAHVVYVVLFALILTASGFFFYRTLHNFGIDSRYAALFASLVVLTSYPWLKLLDRSNLELFVYLFVAVGVWAFITGRRQTAAIMWGFAASMKIYPVLLLVLFFHRSMRRELLIGCATTVASLLASFWFVGPTISVAALGSLHGVFGFLGSYAGTSRVRELNIDHSVLGGIKEVCLLDKAHLVRHWKHQSTGYEASVIVISPLLYIYKIRRLPFWNRLSIFLIAIALLPPVSYDYTLIYIYIAMGIVTAAYLHALQIHKSFPHAKLFFISFALIASSQGWVQHSIMAFNGLIKCIALLALFGLLLFTPLTLGREWDSGVEAATAA
jgi:hypothetical protein